MKKYIVILALALTGLVTAAETTPRDGNCYQVCTDTYSSCTRTHSIDECQSVPMCTLMCNIGH